MVLDWGTDQSHTAELLADAEAVINDALHRGGGALVEAVLAVAMRTRMSGPDGMLSGLASVVSLAAAVAQAAAVSPSDEVH